MGFYHNVFYELIQEQSMLKGNAVEVIINNREQLLAHLIKLLAFKSRTDIKHHFTSIDNQFLANIWSAKFKSRKYWKPKESDILDLIMPDEEDIDYYINFMQNGDYSTLLRLYPDDFIKNLLIHDLYPAIVKHIFSVSTKDNLDIESVFNALHIDLTY